MLEDRRPFVLTTLQELGKEPVILQRNHIFYSPDRKDIFLNMETFNANAHRLVDIAPQLEWGQNSVWRFID